jgi:hypothetical protein
MEGAKRGVKLPLFVRGVLVSFISRVISVRLIRILVLYLSAGIKEGSPVYDMEALAGVSAIQGYCTESKIVSFRSKVSPKIKLKYTPCFIC